MKLGLVSSLMRDHDIEHQLAQMEDYLKSNPGCDILCFGESFLQGFEGLTWDYEEDLKRALALDDPVIRRVQALASQYHSGLSFGFIEKEEGMLYSSYLVIDAQGKIRDLFRRVSPGWKEHHADDHYREGKGFHPFSYGGRVLGTAICGDLWDDGLLNGLNQLKMDALLWPLYVDYTIGEWEESIRDEYVQRVKDLPYPVFMINSFVEDDPHRAKGGCYVFFQNRVIASLPMGETGILEVQID